MKNQRLNRVMAGLFTFTVTTTSVFSANFSQVFAEEGNYELDITNVHSISKGYESIIESLNSKTSMEMDEQYKKDEEVSIIVEFEDKPLLDYYLETTSDEDVHSFIESSRGQKINDEIVDRKESVKEKVLDTVEATVENEYNVVMNGMSITAKYEDLDKIKDVEGVKNAFVSAIYYLPDQEEETIYEPRMKHSAGTIKATEANNSGYSGESMVVAVIDSGLDINHEAFNNTPKNPKYSEDDINKVMEKGGMTAKNKVYKNVKVPFAYDYADGDDDVTDHNGHGTHVAGIVTANSEEIKGVAPEAQLMCMKVFGDKGGGAKDSNILSAAEDAVKLGVDSINMSIGTEAGFTEEGYGTIDETYNRIADSGINLLCAAGNAYSSTHETLLGDLPLVTNPDNGLVDSPSSYNAAISVASLDNEVTTSPYFMFGEGKIVYSDSNAGTDKDFMTLWDKNLEYVVIPGFGEEKDYEGQQVKGKIALIKRGGGPTFPEKEANAEKAGAIGAIVYDHSPGGLTSMQTDEKIPMVFISMQDGVKLVNADKKNIKVLKNAVGEFPLETAGEMSDFSSWGVTPDLKLKPEITAPGGEIYSTLPGGAYGTKGGTSMASPHMTGATAVVKQYIKQSDKFQDKDPKDQEYLTTQLLMSTAKTVTDPNGVLYSPRKQGAGLANLLNAVKTEAYLIGESVNGKPKAELGENKEGQFSFKFKIKNVSDKALTYKTDTMVLTEKIVENEGKKFFEQASEKLDKSQVEVNIDNEITVGPKETNEVEVSLKVTETLKDKLKVCENGTFIDGFVTLVSQNEDKIDLNLPFVGFYGDWQKAPVIDKSMYDGEEAAIYETALGYFDEVKEKGYVLGINLWREKDSKIIAKKDKIAIGKNASGDFRIKSYVGLLRNPREIIYSVEDCNKNILYERKDGKHRKSIFDSGKDATHIMDFWGWDGTDPKTGKKVEDGVYTYKISALPVDGTGDEIQTMEFPITIDNELPEFVDAKVVKKDGKKYLEITVKDNHYLQAIQLENEEGKPITDIITVDKDEKGSEYKEYFDLNQIKLDKVKVFAVDYAQNTLTTEPVLITEDHVQATSISINDRNLIIGTESQFQMKANINPINTKDKTLTWKSSNNEVATITKEGLISALTPGNTDITVSTVNGKKDTVTVKVIDKEDVTTDLESPFIISEDGNYKVPAELANKEITIKDTAKKVAIVGEETKTSEDPYKSVSILCEGNVDLTINNLNCENNKYSKSVIKFEGVKNSLILRGINNLTNTAAYSSGAIVSITNGKEIEIKGKGTLNVTSAKSAYGACIGGEDSDGLKDSGTINISEGTINATTYGNGAAIGGAGNGIATNINISGGKVNATAEVESFTGTAAIGSGDSAKNDEAKLGNITVTGGDVTVGTNGSGAGIGECGKGNTDYNILISGGTINAEAASTNKYAGGAAIGAGEDSTGKITIDIKGGIVNASTATKGAAIGGAYRSGSGVINIDGGTITAAATSDGAAIGSGYRGKEQVISILRGTVKATGVEGKGEAIGKGVYGEECVLKGQDNKTPYLVNIPCKDVTSVKVDGVDWNITKGHNEDDNLYLYMVSKIEPYKLEISAMNKKLGYKVNVSDEGTVSYEEVDVIPPVMPIILEENSIVTVKAADEDTKVIEYSFDKESWTEYKEPVKVEEGGTIYARAKDGAGNISEVTSYTVPDRTAPGIPIIAEKEGVVTIKAADEDTKVIEYSLDNEKWTEYKEPVKVEEGATIYARAKDKAGNISGVVSYTVPTHKIEEIVPTSPILSEEEGMVTLIAADKETVRMEYSFDGEKWTEYEVAIKVEPGKIIYARSISKTGVISGVVAYMVPEKTVVDKITTLAGKDRYETAIKVSKEGWKNSQVAVLANGYAFADALVAAPLAASYNAPILLTETEKLTEATLEELTRLKVKTVYVVGGDSVVSEDVVKELKSQGIEVVRLSGETRYDTSLEVAKHLVGEEKVNHIYVTGGNAPADALTIASKAAIEKTPIILVETVSIPKDVVEWIKSKELKLAYVIGGESVVDNAVFAKLNEITGEDIIGNRISGANRYETNAVVLDKFFARKQECIYVTESIKLVDSLVVAPLAAKTNSPVVIINNELSIGQQLLLDHMSSKKVVKVGGQVHPGTFEDVIMRLNK